MMAINNLNVGNNSSQQAGASQAPSQGNSNNSPFNSNASQLNSLGYYPGDLKFMTSNKASEYASSLSDAVSKIYKSAVEFSDVRVFILDKEVIPGLYYSFLVIARKVGDKLYYFTSALEATGRKPMTAKAIDDEAKAAAKANTVSTELWTIGDTYNIVLRDHIINLLKSNYSLQPNDLYNVISADGCTIRYFAEDIEVTARSIAAIAYNALLVTNRLDDPKNGDLNISIGAQQTKDASLHIQSVFGKSTSYDEMGNPVRADWKLELCLKQNKVRFNNLASVDELNKENSNIVLTKCCGFVDAIPDVKITVQPGVAPIRDIRLRPHIVITGIGPIKPTIGFMLLGFLTSRIMANRNMWLANVLPDGSKYHTGGLNLKTCLEAEADPKYRGKPGMILPFNGTGKDKLTNQEIYSYVNRMFALEPIVSIDIPAYGPQTYYTSILSAAASGNLNKNTTGALKALIDTVVALTNGQFPTDFPLGDVFNHEGILVPLGTWRDPKTGALRDIRDIDLSMIALETQSLELMDMWTISNLPQSVTRQDPYMTKVSVISKVVPDAEIFDKAARVTFTNKFMTELDNAAMRAGLNLRYEPEIKVPEDNSMSVMEGYLTAAAASELPGFARPYTFNGPTYRTSWLSSGGRYM